MCFWEAAWPHRGLKALYARDSRYHPRDASGILITAVVILVGGVIVGGWGIQHFPLPVDAFDLSEVRDLETIGSMVTQVG